MPTIQAYSILRRAFELSKVDHGLGVGRVVVLKGIAYRNAYTISNKYLFEQSYDSSPVENHSPAHYLLYRMLGLVDTIR